ncbi:hypothetical protein EDEG_02754 [Edhazardia aedis USNM 41457]|uniref:Uncharacterized protein n=1 Tax=Edhazardia aedis (strain USNM 41457) TaxID=1003232 RepID=J9D5P9_EDHAE|nr:hypothetical protein EDEG_02754 [Edhazardia aedis USNM 41457]|eukprot:EJW02874.1 hypothetical protein EDEG_02754 [Edhazardia aedis USNM 41457]
MIFDIEKQISIGFLALMNFINKKKKIAKLTKIKFIDVFDNILNNLVEAKNMKIAKQNALQRRIDDIHFSVQKGNLCVKKNQECRSNKNLSISRDTYSEKKQNIQYENFSSDSHQININLSTNNEIKPVACELKKENLNSKSKF